MVISRWIYKLWEQLSAQTVANGFKKCKIIPNEECIAAASLMSLLERWSLVDKCAVAPEHDFDCDNSEYDATV